MPLTRHFTFVDSTHPLLIVPPSMFNQVTLDYIISK